MSGSRFPLNSNKDSNTQAVDRLATFHQYRALLFSIAYRMLGSAADAEDMVQDTFIRFQQSTEEEIRSPKAFLVTIVSRLCINQLKSARARREEYVGHWLPEPLMTEPLSGASTALQIDESLSMGFLVLLERLTPVERAVFLLREVFDYEYSEIARILKQSEANCRQILRRARQRVTEGRPRFDSSPKQRRELMDKFLDATLRGDMNGLLSLFSRGIVCYTDGGGKATALPNAVHGPDDIARMLLGVHRKFRPAGVVLRIVEINGEPGLVSYLGAQVQAVFTLDVIDGQIRNIYIMRNPDKLGRVHSIPS